MSVLSEITGSFLRGASTYTFGSRAINLMMLHNAVPAPKQLAVRLVYVKKRACELSPTEAVIIYGRPSSCS